jgi:hypothetical protein
MLGCWFQDISTSATRLVVERPSRATFCCSLRLGFTLLLLACLASRPAKADQDFSGTWKGNCSDDFGLLVQRADGHQYSVIFCGLSACSRSWTPNTKIKGDPKYRIFSDDQVGIRRLDSSKQFIVYHRCPNDSTLLHRLNGDY